MYGGIGLEGFAAAASCRRWFMYASNELLLGGGEVGGVAALLLSLDGDVGAPEACLPCMYASKESGGGGVPYE